MAMGENISLRKSVVERKKEREKTTTAIYIYGLPERKMICEDNNTMIISLCKNITILYILSYMHGSLKPSRKMSEFSNIPRYAYIRKDYIYLNNNLLSLFHYPCYVASLNI